MGFHGNQKPNLDWTLPKIHVDYEHLKFEEKNRADMVRLNVTLCYVVFLNQSVLLYKFVESEPFANC